MRGSFHGEFGPDGQTALAGRCCRESAAEGGDAFAHPELSDAGQRGGVRRGLAVVVHLEGIANGSLGATAAVVAGLIAMALGGLVAAPADGGLGTGNGLGGAYVALLLGLAGVALGGRALTGSRHIR
ncbi:DUF6223 family protein [Streptomyces sp. NPDC058619]|uniref:DUF6223 family protein n=1 Tax=unclassified Streptomyces TaxID=2593676 RepID=UPI00365563E7